MADGVAALQQVAAPAVQAAGRTMERAGRASPVALGLTGVGLAKTVAALSFTTVLGVVPLFTVAFAYVARYPLFERAAPPASDARPTGRVGVIDAEFEEIRGGV